MSSLLRRIAAAMTIIAMVFSAAAVAGAHTELAIAVPDIGAKVGGNIDRIELTFFGPVSEASAYVETPSDQRIDGSVTQPAPNGVWIALDQSLEESGQYIVRYTTTSADGDSEEAAYAFVYDPANPEVVFEGPAPGEDTSPLTGIIVAALALGFVLLLFLAMRRRSTPIET